MAAKKEKTKVTPLKTTSAKDVLGMMGKLEKTNEFHAIELERKKPTDFLSTGSLALDLITGGGAYGGQVIQFYGAAHCGKSSLGYSMAAWLSQQGIPIAIFDHEGTTDKAYTERLGVDYDLVKYFRPETGEKAFKFIVDLCEALPDKFSGLPQAAIVVDTVAAMKPQKFVENPENKQPGVRAAMHSQAWVNLQTLMTNKHIAIIALNQVRSSAGAMYTSPEVLPGGNPWAFATGVLVRQSRGKVVELPNGKVFQEVKFKTQKNKNFIPLQEAKIHLELGEGFDIASDVQEFCKLAGYFYKRGKGGQKVVGKGLPTMRGLNAILMEHDPEVKKLVKEATAAKREKLKAEATKPKVEKPKRSLSKKAGKATEGEEKPATDVPEPEVVAKVTISKEELAKIAKEELTEKELMDLIGADGDYAGASKFEEHIREQGRTGVIFRACRIALSTGIAIDLYRKSKNKTELEEVDEDLLSTKKNKNTDLGDDNVDEDEDSDDELDD